MKKFYIWCERNWVLIVLTYITAFLLLLGFSFCANYNTRNTIERYEQELVKVKTSYNGLTAVLIKNDSIQFLGDPGIYELRKDVNELQMQNASLGKKIEEAHSEWWRDFLKFYGTIGALLGFGLAGLGARTYLKSNISEIEEKVRNEMHLELSSLTGVDIQSIKRSYESEILNLKIRKEAKIICVNEKDTAINETLKRIFNRLNGLGAAKAEIMEAADGIDILTTEYAQELIKAKYNLVIIDNCFCNERKWEGDAFDGKLIEFTHSLLEAKVAVFYFSEGVLFPMRDDKFKKLKNKELLSYANSHSQAYSNIMNLLKNQYFIKNNL